MDDTQRITWPTRDSRMDLWNINQFPDMDRLLESYEVPGALAEGTTQILTTAVALFRHAFYHYEFLMVAFTWTMFALEPELQAHYGTKNQSLQTLLERAHDDGLIRDSEHDMLRDVRRLRNRITHGGTARSVMLPGLARGSLETATRIIVRIRDAHLEQP